MSASSMDSTANFSVYSSVAEDVWHEKSTPESYEWWYFDALSDDARDGLVIIFLDNFIFSPRYNSQNDAKHPAIAFIFYHDGKPIYRSFNEFSSEDFSSEKLAPSCKIGESVFQIEATPYGIRYILNISANLSGGKKIKGSYEWLLLDANFLPDQELATGVSHHWNLVAPRCDVTGKLEVFSKQGKLIDVRQFRGSGYHDHNFDTRRLPQTVESWQWGRAHFADSTAVFYRYKELGKDDLTTKLFIVRDGELRIRDAEFEEQQISRDKFGVKYPNRIRFLTDDNIRLRVKQNEIIDSSFFYLRFLSEMTLTLRDGIPRKVIGITEQLSPKALNFRWLDWLVDMRIGRNGKAAFLP